MLERLYRARRLPHNVGIVRIGREQDIRKGGMRGGKRAMIG
jgi:hypothetical protein